MKKDNTNINVSDLIILGICFLFYLITFVLVVHISIFLSPLFYPVMPALVAIFEGFIYLILITKVKKFGIVTLFSILISFSVAIFGHGGYILIAPLFGLLADLILKQGKFTSWRHIVASYSIFSIGTVAAIAQLYLSVDAYKSDPAMQKMGTEFVRTITVITPLWSLPIVIVITMIGAVIGIYLGRKINKKILLAN